jgi:peptide/nickel transport system permease protein
VLLRIGNGLISVFGITLIVFVAARASGDPANVLLPLDATQEQRDFLTKDFGLDKPIFTQYAIYMKNALQGDLGDSFRYRQPAVELVVDRLPATALLASSAAVLALLIAVPLGIFAALYRGTWIDSASTMLAAIGQSAPSFVIGILAILVFAVELGWLPPVGMGGIKHLIMPAATLALAPLAVLSRLTRSAMIEAMQSDYVRTARAKGLRETSVVLRHALRNSLLTIVTMFALQVAVLLGGSIIVEQVFAWPGVGRAAADAVSARDFPMVQAVAVILSIIYVTINLLTDLSYVVIDPRLRVRG